jgi:hypothetical protein
LRISLATASGPKELTEPWKQASMTSREMTSRNASVKGFQAKDQACRPVRFWQKPAGLSHLDWCVI